jgi:hypothetical protein
MKRILMIVGLSLLSTPALAQQTLCTRTGPGSVYCNTSPSIENSIDSFGDAINKFRAAQQQKEQQELIRQMTDAIRAGNCPLARNLALTYERLDLAEQAQRLCPIPSGK